MIKVIYMVHECLRQNKGVSKLSTAQDLKDFTTVESHSIQSPAQFFFCIQSGIESFKKLCATCKSAALRPESLSALQ